MALPASTDFGWVLTRDGQPAGEIIEFGDFDLRTAEVERTHHGSPNAKEFISSRLMEFQPVELTLAAKQADVDMYLADQQSGAIRSYVATFEGDLDPWGFNAIVRRTAVQGADAQSVNLQRLIIELRPTPPFDFGGGGGPS